MLQTEDDETHAPLASMEDLSVLATPMMTPMSTPGQSPKTRARYAHNPEWPLTSTPKHDDIPARRFASPARQSNLLKQSIMNNTQNNNNVNRNYRNRNRYPYRPMNNNGNNWLCDPIQENPIYEHPESNDDEEMGFLNGNGKQASSQKQVQFLTPREPKKSCSSRTSVMSASRYGYRVSAAQELFGEEPRDRYK